MGCRFESYRVHHSLIIAGMAELVDALDLGSSGEIHGGSSPFTRTRLIGSSNFYKFESNKLLTEMLVFLLFKKGKVMSYDNRN